MIDKTKSLYKKLQFTNLDPLTKLNIVNHFFQNFFRTFSIDIRIKLLDNNLHDNRFSSNLTKLSSESI